MTPMSRSRTSAGGARTVILPSRASTSIFSPRPQTREEALLSNRRPGGDRFIPNRSEMNMDLCRASILAGEKRRMECMAAARQRRRLDNNSTGNDATDDDSPPPTPQRPTMTPLQAEFNRRMKAALFDIPLDRLEKYRPSPVSVSSSRSDEGPMNLLSARSTRSNSNDVRDLAYASIPELEAAAGIDASATYSGSDYSDDMPLMSFGSSSTRTRSRAHMPPIDPYEHDQLHVLQRSVAKSSYGRVLSMAGLDATERSLPRELSKVGRRVAKDPTRVLEAPDLKDDYYLNLISWSSDNILAVALGPSVYLYNPSSQKIQELMKLPGPEDYITSVAWSTVPGMSSTIAIAAMSCSDTYGLRNNSIQLWDAQTLQRVQFLRASFGRLSVMAWNPRSPVAYCEWHCLGYYPVRLPCSH